MAYDKERAEARTLDELKLLAQKRGYSVGWALRLYEIRQHKQQEKR